MISLYQLQQKKSPQKKKLEHIKAPHGLPNIGNSCFFNSVIQLLFSAAAFRNLLIGKVKERQDIALQKKEFSASECLGHIFLELEKEEQSNENKKRYLQALLEHLPSLNVNYKMYSQEDVLQTLKNLLFFLDYSKKQQLQISKLFEIEREIQCRCLKQPIFSSILIQLKEPQSCGNCGQIWKVNYLKLPQYLIVVERNKDKWKQFGQKDENIFGDEEFKILTRIQYFGNGNCGHYICLSFIQKCVFIINDNHASKFNHQNINYLRLLYPKRFERNQESLTSRCLKGLLYFGKDIFTKAWEITKNLGSWGLKHPYTCTLFFLSLCFYFRSQTAKKKSP